MGRYILRRVVMMPFILLGMITLTFIASHLIGGDPIASIVGLKSLNNPEIVAAARKEWGLDGNIASQYVHYVNNLLHGDFGRSFTTRQPVLDDVKQRFPATAELTVAAMIVGTVGGVGLGVLAAARKGKVTDFLVRMFALVGASVPVFWTGLVLLSIFYARLGWLPGPGRLPSRTSPPTHHTGLYTVDSIVAGDWTMLGNSLKHLFLPGFVLGWALIGGIARTVRATVLDELHADYVRTARAKGLGERAVFMRHVLRNAILPVLTLLGLAFASLLTGAALLETIFSWNGVGNYAVLATRALDFPAVYGTAILAGLIFLMINLITDVLYSYADPKVRLS